MTAVRQAVLLYALCAALLAWPARSAAAAQVSTPAQQDVPSEHPVPIVLPPAKPKPTPAKPPPKSSTTTAAAGAGTETKSPSKGQAIEAARRKVAVAQPASGTLNRTVVVLDPAHGGLDSGSRIGDSILEKNVTLALAFRLRSLLAARGFTVVMTRDSDAATEANSTAAPLTLDDRAGIANHARAVACLLLHATGSGTGAHLYSSELTPAPAEVALLPWLTAQTAWVTQSQALESRLGSALTRAQIPLVMSAASVRPVDSLTCPALVVELAPEGDDESSVNDNEYQQRVAQAIVGALVFWQNQAVPPVRLVPQVTSTASHGTGLGEEVQP